MPGPAETVNLVDPHGNAYAVPVDQVADAINRGYRVESSGQAAQRISNVAREETYGGLGGAVSAGIAGAARGATFGLSDVVGGALGAGEDLQALRDVNPLASTVGEIGGGLATAFAAPESLLAKTPAGLAARAGMRIAEFGEEAGTVARAGYSAAGAALEGAAQNAGAYVSDVALGDRELSADGFMGAMGKGALWGGVAGGSLSLGSGGLMAARRLFPRQEITREAVQAAETVARREVSSAVEDGETLARAARDRLRVIRAEAAERDLAVKSKLDEIAVREAEAVSKANVSKAEAQAERAQVQLEKAKAPTTARRTRKALQEEESVASAPAPVEVPGAGDSASSAVASSVAEDPTTLLERQLAGTKAGLDAGETLAQLNAKRPTVIGLKPTHVEDALNAEVAKIDPEAARLVKGLDELEGGRDAVGAWLDKYKGGDVSKFERNQATRDYAEGMRKKSGYVSVVPKGEGDALLPRGRMYEFRGSPELRDALDAKTMAKLSAEEKGSADDAIAEMFARKEQRQIGQDIAEGKPTAPAVDEQVAEAVTGKTDSIDDDISQSADAIGRFEAASADLTEALGPAAPTSSQARGQAFKEAQGKAEQASTDATARATADAEKAAHTIGLAPPEHASRLGSILERAQDIGTAAEALRAIGIDVPDPRSIPVVGPLLGAYLKARLVAKTFGRFGGKVAETAESTIASKAAQTKQRVYAAVDKMLETASRGAAVASGKIGAPAAMLGHVLFADHDEKARTPYTSDAPKGSLQALYLARADEVNRAMAPGAIEESVRKRVRASDPAIVDAIAEAQRRKLEYYDSKMPRPNEPPLPGQARMPWIPSKAQIAQWGRIVQAGEDPVGVIEAAAKGGYVSIEAVDTLRTVYPRLFQEAQARILQRVEEHPEAVPYHRRVQLSVMFDMPMDGSQTPEGAAFLQESYKPAPPPVQPQPQMGTPTVSADVRMSDRTSPETRT